MRATPATDVASDHAPDGKALSEVMEQWRDVPTEPELSERAAHYTAEINAKLASAVQSGQDSMSAELRFLNATRECGILIANAKADLSPAQWKLAQAHFEFPLDGTPQKLSERAVQGFLDFSRRFPEPITDAADARRSLEDAQMALGLAEYPEGHGEQQIREVNMALEITKHVTGTLAKLEKLVTAHPVTKMAPSYASQCASVIAPTIKRLNDIYSQVVERSHAA